MGFLAREPNKVKWMVTLFDDLIPCSEVTILSPEFYLPDSTWCLVFNRPRGVKDAMWVHLCRRDYGPPKNIKYTIKAAAKEISRTQNFAGRNANSEKIKVFKNEVRKDYGACLDIICCINDATFDGGAKGKIVTSAVQQKNLPDCISRAIQAELENSEEEVPKAEEWASIEMKDVVLLSERMKELLIKSSDHDLTICVQGKKFRAHRSILSIRSPVFAMMLGHDTKENSTSTINIEDCDPESFDEFLLYVYSGRTENLTPSNAGHLYYSADKYDFPVLKERCVSFLKTSLSVESVCDVVLLAAKHQEEELLKVATKFFARNMKKILTTVSWQKFMAQNPVEANELMIKNVDINNPEN